MSAQCVCDVCFAVGDEAQAIDTRMFTARPVDDGAVKADIAVSEIAEVPLNRTDAPDWYFSLDLLFQPLKCDNKKRLKSFLCHMSTQRGAFKKFVD